MGQCAKSHVCLQRSLGGMAAYRTAQRHQRGWISINTNRSTREAINLCSEKRLLSSIKFVFIIKICSNFLRILKSSKRETLSAYTKGSTIFFKPIIRISFTEGSFS